MTVKTDEEKQRDLKAYRKAYRLEHKEKIQNYRMAYYEKYKEKIKAKRENLSEEKKQKLRDYHKAYRIKHKKKLNKRARDWMALAKTQRNLSNASR